MVYALELRTGLVTHEGQIPLQWSAARTLEVDPPNPLTSEQAVAFVRLTVERLRYVGAVVESQSQVSEAPSQKFPIVGRKCSHRGVPGEDEFCVCDLVAKTRQRDVDSGHGVVEETQ